MDTVIEIKGLTIGYKGRQLLEPFDAALPRGSLTVLVGANGAGKSTLIKTLCRDLRPLSGRIAVDGRDLDTMSTAGLAGAVSAVYTQRGVGGGLTVEQLAGMGRFRFSGFMGNLSRRDREVVDKALKVVGMDGMARRHLADLSDGERQKAFIAKALAQDTPVIVLDEPTSFLDAGARIEVMGALKTLARQGKTILLSTHDLHAALEVCDFVMVMARGRARMMPVDDDNLWAALDEVFVNRGVHFDPAAGDFRVTRQAH